MATLSFGLTLRPEFFRSLCSPFIGSAKSSRIYKLGIDSFEHLRHLDPQGAQAQVGPTQVVVWYPPPFGNPWVIVPL